MLGTLPAPLRILLAALLVASVIWPVSVRVDRHGSVKVSAGAFRAHLDRDGVAWWRVGCGACLQAMAWDRLDISAPLHTIGAHCAHLSVALSGAALALALIVVAGVEGAVFAWTVGALGLWMADDTAQTVPEHGMSSPWTASGPVSARRVPAYVRVRMG